jgi:peptidoglycan L-alanyl-D-glutamate endopeptidase CwlK
MDTVSIDRINKLHPAIRNEVLSLYNQANAALSGRAQMRVVQGYRTFKEQDGYYALGRTVVNPDGKSSKRPMGNKVTNAKAGQSYHNYGLAIDFCLLIDGKEISWDTVKDWDGDKQADWIEVVLIFTKAGYKWGKAFNDMPHLEKSFGKDWRDYLALHNAGKVDANGYVLIAA